MAFDLVDDLVVAVSLRALAFRHRRHRVDAADCERVINVPRDPPQRRSPRPVRSTNPPKQPTDPLTAHHYELMPVFVAMISFKCPIGNALAKGS